MRRRILELMNEGKVRVAHTSPKSPHKLPIVEDELKSHDSAVNVIYEDEVDPKVSSMMKRQGFLPGLGLGRQSGYY